MTRRSQPPVLGVLLLLILTVASPVMAELHGLLSAVPDQHEMSHHGQLQTDSVMSPCDGFGGCNVHGCFACGAIIQTSQAVAPINHISPDFHYLTLHHDYLSTPPERPPRS